MHHLLFNNIVQNFTEPVYNDSHTGTVPLYNDLSIGTVPVYNDFQTGTVPVYNFFQKFLYRRIPN